MAAAPSATLWSHQQPAQPQPACAYDEDSSSWRCDHCHFHLRCSTLLLNSTFFVSGGRHPAWCAAPNEAQRPGFKGVG